MKQIPRLTVRIIVAARELVDQYNSSVIGIPVEVPRTLVGSLRQKSMARMKRMPLVRVNEYT